jgi:hypothetical protein
LAQADAASFLWREERQVVIFTPVEHLAIPINADGHVLRVTANPLASRVGRPAEIFSQQLSGAVSQGRPGLLDEIDFRLGVLHRLLVKGVTVRPAGHAVFPEKSHAYRVNRRAKPGRNAFARTAR